MPKRFFSIIAFAALTLWAVVAMAADMLPAHAPVDAIGGALTGTVFPIITALLMGFLTFFLKKLTTKYHLDGLLKHQDLLEKVALQGIGMAEERAAAWAKSGLEQRMNGREKLAVAVNHIAGIMPKVSDEQARNIVNSLLARIPGVGATGDKALTLDGLSVGMLSTPLEAAPAAAAPA